MEVHRLIATLLLGLLIVGCSQPSLPPATPVVASATAAPAPGVDEDAFAEVLLKDKSHCQPALGWLENRRDHILWKGDREAIKVHFQELTAAGTGEIWACTHDLKDKQICAAFVVVLPSSEGDRKRALELHNRFWAGKISDPLALDVVEQHEHHQKYLLYSFD